MPNWTDEERDYLSLNYGLKTDTAIAKHLGRTVGAIRQYANSNMKLCRTDQFMTASDVARIFGVWVAQPCDWIKAGKLKATKSKVVKSGGGAWVITEQNLLQFMKDYPTLYDPTRIDRFDYSFWRKEAEKAAPLHVVPLAQRRRGYWTPREDEMLLSNYRRLTYPQLSAKLNRSHEAIHARLMLLRAKGRLAPYKELWQNRERNGTAKASRGAEWSQAEDDYLRMNWQRLRRSDEPGRGSRVTAMEIARHLGRSYTGVTKRASRLGMVNYLKERAS